MQTTRYTGEDIAIGIEFLDDEDVIIAPDTLTGIKAYLVDQYGVVKGKYAEPEAEGYKPMFLSATEAVLYIERDMSKELADAKLSLEVRIETDNDDLENNQVTIAVSEFLIIKNAAIKEEL